MNFEKVEGEKSVLEEIDFEKELRNIDSQITNGEVDVIEAGKLIYKINKLFENRWKSLQEEVFDELDSKYQRQELTEMGITLRSARRVDAKSYLKDAEYNLAKQTIKTREELMKTAYKHFQDTGEDYVVGDEIIPMCEYGKASKSVSFKLK